MWKCFWDFLNAGSDGIVAICALVVSIYVAVKQNQFYKDSVRPFCNIVQDNVENTFTIIIQNVGLGPMVITSVRYEGKLGKSGTKLGDVLQDICFLRTENKLDGKGIVSGDQMLLLKLEVGNRTQMKSFWEKISNLSIKVCYQDMYGKEYKTCLKLQEEYKEYRKVINFCSLAEQETAITMEEEKRE